jgi:hypothetical protein
MTAPRKPNTVFGVAPVGQETDAAGFSAVGASVLDPFFVQTPIVGSGVGYNQASGSLNITTGVATNAEFLARSVNAFSGPLRLRFTLTASQRIANQNLAVMLADLIGQNLQYTIVNATTVDVTLVHHGFTAQMVGQFMFIGGISGAAGVPGRYAIASLPDANTVRFTVAGWPASGNGLCTLFGRNYIRNLVTGTTATNVAFDAQRNGWATGDTTATINTTAAPGTLIQNEWTGRDLFLSDTLRASATAPNFTTRASRYENLPELNQRLYVFVWSFNGTTAPASTTTWTMGHLAVERYPNQVLTIGNIRAQGAQNALPTSVATALPAGANTIGAVNIAASQTLAAVTSANLGIPALVADVASAALTSTATVAAITPGFGLSYEVNIPVTAVTGTTPTLDVVVQESDDSGTNWYDVYHFPRITAIGMYRSPVLPLTGNRVRYVQTVGGTTPSFTRAINRLQISRNAPALRQLIDRAVSLTTLNATTASLQAQDGGNRLQLVVNVGAITTTAPQLQLEGSDDNGLTWYAVGSPLTAVASSTVQVTVTNVHTQLLRARVSTAGVGVTAGYVLLKAHD